MDYVIPHSSSMVIYGNLIEAMKNESFELYKREWFTNLTWVGNIGSSAILAALDEFCSTRKLKSGEKILLLVPVRSPSVRHGGKCPCGCPDFPENTATARDRD